jgi:glycosyltransferase involved in cell wall biosynthesis
MNGHKKVLYIVNIPSPYMVTFFNMLSEKVDLTVIFEKKYDKTRPNDWKKIDLSSFKYEVLKGISYTHEQIIPFKYKKYVNRNFDYIFIQNFFTPTGILISRYLINKKINYGIVSEGGDIKTNNHFKEKLKHYTVKHASFYLSSSNQTDLFLKYYGANENHIIRYPFTSLHEQHILKKPLSKEEKLVLRNKYHIPHDARIILTVGRLIKEKNHEYIIHNLSQVKKKYEFILVGDGYDQKIVKKLNSIKHIFIKELDYKSLLEYYQLSDLFVLASISEPWGLVVNEAMSQGCVVATSQYVNASKALIDNHVNGFIFNIEEEFELAKIINGLEEEKLEKMSILSLDKIKSYTFENMINIFIKVINS